MVQVSTPPFRADHVGSLLRPKELLRAREDEREGRITKTGLRRIEDQAIREVVKMQADAGLEDATDGEFRRGSWHMDFLYQVGGVSKVQGTANVQFKRAADGVFKLLEVNPRFPGTLPLTGAAGIDMPKLLENARLSGVDPITAIMGTLQEKLKGLPPDVVGEILGAFFHNQQARDAARRRLVAERAVRVAHSARAVRTERRAGHRRLAVGKGDHLAPVADQAVVELAFDVVLERPLGPGAEVGGVNDEHHGGFPAP